MRTIIDQNICATCGSCHANCPTRAITRRGAEYHVTAFCTGCGTCQRNCPTGAAAKGTEDIEFDHRKVAAALKEKLDLTKPVVALKYASQAPEGVPVEEGPTFWCAVCGEMLAGESEPVYFTKDASLCGGAGMFGLGSRKGVTREDMHDALEGAQVLGEGGHYLTMSEMTKSRDQFPPTPKMHNGMVVGTLDKVKMPDMVMLPVNVAQLSLISTAYTFDTGRIIKGSIGAAACITNAAGPMYTNRPTFTNGDHGARQFMNLTASEMLVSFPYKMIPGLLINLDRTAGAKEDDA